MYRLQAPWRPSRGMLIHRVFAGILAFAALALAQTPQISGVVNAANFQPPVAPGALISIFGSNLATGQASARAVPLPGNLLGTVVSINGIAAPLLYVSPTQINAQLPYEIPPNTSAKISVQVNNAASSTATVAVGDVAPAIFTLPGTGLGPGAILNTNYSVVMDSNPAQPGEIVQIFATGLGATTPPVSTGLPGDGQRTAQSVTVTIGGVNAVVAFAGAAPGLVGVDQVNATVPNISSGDQSIVISISGARSSANVTIPIASGSSSPGMISPTYFGMELSQPYFLGLSPWPAIPYRTVRLNADDITWADLEPANGVFNFTPLDEVLAGGAAHGLTPADFIYTLVKTPAWASSNPLGTGCSDHLNRPGGCFAPSDVNSDGTGTDAAWKGFVTAIVSHVCPTSTSCLIQNWEGWNEPNNPDFWQSTTPQMVRMQKDAYQIIKGISSNLTVVSPSVAPGGGAIENGISWITGFLNAGGKGSQDIMGFHGYLVAGKPPEGIATTVHDWLSLLSSQALSSLPLWDTEGSWGQSTNLPDPDEQVAFLGRYYLLQSSGVSRFYWYSYNTTYGTLEANNVLTKAGVAYGFVYQWLVGATVANACESSGGSSIWTCSFTRPGGYKALAVWDSSLTCGNGVCSTSGYTTPSGYTQFRDLQGDVTAIQPNSQISISAKPILLENQNPPL
jgi:uncharacterized protein (TIGR03437 family)